MTARRQRKRIEKRRRQHRSLSELSAADPTALVPKYRLAERAEPLVYTRTQAAEALGISLATLDRRIVPALNTVKTPSGTRLIPVSDLERFLKEHTQVAAVEFSPGRRAGRRATVPAPVVERIQHEHVQGKSLGKIARGLTADGVATAHGGRRWWPSTVRGVLNRAAPMT